jgi:SpoIID/LytB domain protein
LGEVKKAKAYQSDLTNKIAQLSAKQQQLIAEKLGSLNLPTSLGGGNLNCTDDRKLDPGFSNAYAFYTYGIPHRVGLDQYGAYGRAKAGQSAEDILRAYFDNFDFVTGKEGETVKVNGKNEFGQEFNNESMNVEEYLKHLYEMPTSWDNKALEAQAIAARSYALSEMRTKGFVYPSQSDQVVKKELNAQSWISAVEATKGKIIAQGGQAVKAWYASTAGGYTFNSGDIWSRNTSYTKRLRDTTGDIGGFEDLKNKAYDRESPCFYSAQGWRAQYAKSAWLKQEEVADIVNVLMLAQKDSGTQNHLSQIDKANPDGTDTWDMEKVKTELRSRGGKPFNSISGVSVSADFGIGKTTNVTINGDAGSQTFSANDFVNYFNLRAPANIQIVGPLFNIEKK